MPPAPLPRLWPLARFSHSRSLCKRRERKRDASSLTYETGSRPRPRMFHVKHLFQFSFRASPSSCPACAAIPPLSPARHSHAFRAPSRPRHPAPRPSELAPAPRRLPELRPSARTATPQPPQPSRPSAPHPCCILPSHPRPRRRFPPHSLPIPPCPALPRSPPPRVAASHPAPRSSSTAPPPPPPRPRHRAHPPLPLQPPPPRSPPPPCPSRLALSASAFLVLGAFPASMTSCAFCCQIVCRCVLLLASIVA